jgi:16S rRNA (cytidine1402-2'-O)-methyltransferase
MSGQLILVATPIGNLGDISERMKLVLEQADIIACEDSRHSGRLVKHMGITSPKYIVVNDHTERDACDGIIEAIMGGKTVALITDAGTPGMSDPAFLLVRDCIKEGIKVECLPGATAFVPALVNSGIPTNRFVFEGFLPLKKGRQTLLKQLAVEPRTIILYESPMRLVKTLKELATYFGADRIASVSRELTKMFEENKQGSLADLAVYFESKTVKGEIVIVVAGAE